MPPRPPLPAKHFHFAQRDPVPMAVALNGSLLCSVSNQQCTLLSEQEFLAEDTFELHVRVVKRRGGRVVFGVAPSDAYANTAACAKFIPGDREIHDSIGCFIEDGRVATLRDDVQLFSGRCNTQDPTVITMILKDDTLSFKIDGVPFTSPGLDLIAHKSTFHCPSGHVLVEQHLKQWTCDVCNASCQACTATGCRRCNYDMCTACVEKQKLKQPRPVRANPYRVAVGLCTENQKVHFLRDPQPRWRDQWSASSVRSLGRTVECNANTPFTQFTEAAFSGREDVCVTLDVRKLAGGAVVFGVVRASETDACRNGTIGTAAMPGSIGCAIADNKVYIIANGKQPFQGRCDTRDPTKVKMTITQGTMTFMIDRGVVNCEELKGPGMRLDAGTQYRIGVSMQKAGQTVTLMTGEDAEYVSTYGQQDHLEQREQQQGAAPGVLTLLDAIVHALGGEPIGAALAQRMVGSGQRFVDNMKSIKCNATDTVAACVKTFPATCHMRAVVNLQEDDVAFTVRLLNLGADKLMVVGVVDENARGHANHCIGSEELKNSFGFSTAGHILVAGKVAGTFTPLPTAGDTITVGFQSKHVSLTVNGVDAQLPQLVHRMSFDGRFRFGVSLPQQGQAVKIGSNALTEEEQRFLTDNGITVATPGMPHPPAAGGTAAAAVGQPAPLNSPPRAARGNDADIDEQVGKYRLDAALVSFSRNDRLGGGAFGTVYRGTWDGVPVAIKEMSWKDDPTQRREILVGRSLSHPHIANIHGWYQHETKLFIVMHLYEEGTLANLLDGVPASKAPVPQQGGPFGWRRFFSISLGILRALRYMATRDVPVIHRDLKPANILMKDGLPQLTDFGTSKEASSLTCQTQAGTPIYMSPEQMNGGQQTPASDMYSFGCVAWQLLMAPKFPRSHCRGLVDLAMEVTTGKPLNMTGVPASLQIIARCFAVDATTRPSANEMIGVFEAAAATLIAS